ncbi:hypothetical protein D9M71_360630 [compost metagenome]
MELKDVKLDDLLNWTKEVPFQHQSNCLIPSVRIRHYRIIFGLGFISLNKLTLTSWVQARNLVCILSVELNLRRVNLELIISERKGIYSLIKRFLIRAGPNWDFSIGAIIINSSRRDPRWIINNTITDSSPSGSNSGIGKSSCDLLNWFHVLRKGFSLISQAIIQRRSNDNWKQVMSIT